MINHCAVCNSEFCPPAQSRRDSMTGVTMYDCPACGKYIITEEADDDFLARDDNWWSLARRSALAFRVRNKIDVEYHPKQTNVPYVTSRMLEAFRNSDALLPPKYARVELAIRYIGDLERLSGDWVEVDKNANYPRVGCKDPDAMDDLLQELVVFGKLREHADGLETVAKYQLTLTGWEDWKDLQKGKSHAGRGIIAMSFGDDNLNSFVEEVVKPAVAEVPGLSLVRIDDPEVVEAGVIDNIMRQAIREASFVIADLSHGNNGAYWEAGYAEGLGKPVIYLCETNTWEERRTHFDTNHCTTIIWSLDNPTDFKRQLIATLKNSLKL